MKLVGSRVPRDRNAEVRPELHSSGVGPTICSQTVEVLAGTIRHYNRGWANGHEWNICYWEIWNEPDGINNMWCLPEGDEPWEAVTPADLAKRERREAAFTEFFVTCVKRVKGEFGDSVKVGGPAMCGFSDSPRHNQVAFFRRILLACKAAGVALDSVGWRPSSSITRTRARRKRMSFSALSWSSVSEHRALSHGKRLQGNIAVWQKRRHRSDHRWRSTCL